MSQNKEQTKLLALAHLKTGLAPKEVAELLNISYSAALKHKKELMQAESKNAVLDLFDLEAAALETLLEKVKTELTPAIDVLEGDLELADALSNIDSSVKKGSALEKELQDAAVEVTRKVAAAAILTNSTETLLTLAEALAKLQGAFFAKGTNVQVNQMGSFERFLKD